MNDAKYIGLDVHQATISATVLDAEGKLVMEAILETKAETILQFIHGLRGSLHVTFEEGTSADWLYTLLKPHVTRVLVCDPRKNALLKVGNKSDRIDSRKLAELLRSNLLRPVFHEDTGLRALQELARSYLTITKDVTRVILPELGYSLWRPASLLSTPSCGLARENLRSQCSPAGGTLLPATRRVAILTPTSQERAAGRRPEARGHEVRKNFFAPSSRGRSFFS